MTEGPPCTSCRLHQAAHTVNVASRGTGTRLLFVGEAPGYEEDRRGLCFVGNAGKELDKRLIEIGIPAEWCRFTNTVRCFPKAGAKWRKPHGDEIKSCVETHLLMEICEVDPELIVPLGSVAAEYFTGYSQLYRARESESLWTHPWTGKEYPVRVTYHPAALLYEGGSANLPKFMADLDQIKARLTGEQRIPYDRYKTIEDLTRVGKLLDALADRWERGEIPFVTVDFETVGLDPLIPRGEMMGGCEGSALLTIQLSAGVGSAFNIPVDHPESPHHRNEISLTALISMFNRFLKRMRIGPRRGIVGHNLKFDCRYGGTCLSLPLKVDWRAFARSILYDTRLSSWFVHGDDLAGIVPDHALETLCGICCQFYAHKEAAAGREKGRMDLWPMESIRRYGCADVDGNYRLGLYFLDKLSDPERFAAYERLMLELIEPSLYMEINGAAVDPRVLATAEKEYEKELEEFPALLRELQLDRSPEGQLWNTNSTQQMARLFFEVLGIQDWYPKPNVWDFWQDATKEYYNQLALEHGLVDRVPEYKKKPDWAERASGFITQLHRTYKEVPVVGEDGTTRREMVLDKEGLPIPVVDPTKVVWSSAKKVLEALTLYVLEFLEKHKGSEHRPYFEGLLRIIKALRQDRKRRVLLSRYIRPLPTYIRPVATLPVGTLVHTNFNICCTGTGRFSSSDPSFHQFPYKSAVLDSFVSRFGPPGILLDCDIKQIEMRIMAVLSQDPVMIATLLEGKDIHWAVTAQCEGRTVEEMMAHPEGSALRRRYKQVSFGVIYGRGSKAIADAEHLAEDHARAIVQNFLEKMTGIGRYKDAQNEFVHTHGYVETPLGWRRPTPYVNSDDRAARAKAERVAVNTPVQGGSSQIISQSIRELYWALTRLEGQGRGLKSLPWNYVHDSHSADIYPGELWEMMVLMRYFFFVRPNELYPWLTVPLEFDLEGGVSWLRACGMGFMPKDGSTEPDLVSRNIYIEGKVDYVTQTMNAMALWPEDRRPVILSTHDKIVEEKPHRRHIIHLPGSAFSLEGLLQ